MRHVRLYTKPICALCDVVKADLESLHDLYPHTLEEIDITQDQDLFLKYRFEIPVVEIGEQRLKAPITAVALALALKSSA